MSQTVFNFRIKNADVFLYFCTGLPLVVVVVILGIDYAEVTGDASVKAYENDAQ